MNKQTSETLPFITILTLVWLILLAFCSLIAILIVLTPASHSSYFMAFLIGSIQVLISMIFIMIWLYGWYRGMKYLLNMELMIGKTTEDSINNHNTN